MKFVTVGKFCLAAIRYLNSYVYVCSARELSSSVIRKPLELNYESIMSLLSVHLLMTITLMCYINSSMF